MWLADCERSSIAGLGLACAYDLRDQGARVSDLPAFSASAALGDPSPPVGSGAAGVSAGPPPVPGGRGSVVFPPAVPPIALPASFAPGVTMDALGASDGVAGTGGATFGEVGPACVFTAGGGAFSHALESIAIAAMPVRHQFLDTAAPFSSRTQVDRHVDCPYGLVAPDQRLRYLHRPAARAARFPRRSGETSNAMAFAKPSRPVRT